MRSIGDPRSLLSLTVALTLTAVLTPPVLAGDDTAIHYPPAKTVDVVEEIHGVKVADPYRWMEDLDSPDVKAWIEAENEITFGWLREIPQRDGIRERLTKLWDYEKFGIPFQEGGRYFYTRNEGLQNQSVLYVANTLNEEPRVLLNPNEWSDDGTVALAGTWVTEDGKLMAYGVADAGSDWREFFVLDVDTGEKLDDHLKWIKFSGASWTRDGKGFYYSRYDEPQEDKLEQSNYWQKLYYHRLGTPQSEDRLVYHTPEHKDWGFGGTVTDDGRYLIITVWQGTERKNRIYYQDLQAEDEQVVKLLDDFDAEYSFLGNDGPVFWFRTDLDAPNGRVIAIDTRDPARENWEEIIPEGKNALRSVSLVNHQFIARYLKDAHSQVKVFETDGSPVREIELPGIGSAYGFGGDPDDIETFYMFTSFTQPPTVYRYDLIVGRGEVFRKPKVDITPSDYETRQVFYKSKDGTRVPMFITHKKGLRLEGDNPTLLYGYGGFDIPITPSFSISNMVWLEMGGVYAVANIRGGGEYGRAWHEAGRLKNKQNVFDDFIAAAEWLIENDYTSTPKLAIYGGSNGGLLVGACITQRPDLFGAAIPAVGVLDMLRFHKYTIGWAWTSDYGSPDDPEMFPVLRAYSPYHNIKPGTCYPPTLITTADHDDRVVPAHSFKFAAAMQAAQGCENPILIRIETRAGHGAGKPTAMIIEEQADKWAFLVRALNMSAPVGAR